MPLSPCQPRIPVFIAERKWKSMHAVCSVQLLVFYRFRFQSLHSIIINNSFAFLKGWRWLSLWCELLPCYLFHCIFHFNSNDLHKVPICLLMPLHAAARPWLAQFSLTSLNSALLPGCASKLAFNVLTVLNSWQFPSHTSFLHTLVPSFVHAFSSA